MDMDNYGTCKKQCNSTMDGCLKRNSVDGNTVKVYDKSTRYVVYSGQAIS